jgi:hypothetical protein
LRICDGLGWLRTLNLLRLFGLLNRLRLSGYRLRFGGPTCIALRAWAFGRPVLSLVGRNLQLLLLLLNRAAR